MGVPPVFAASDAATSVVGKLFRLNGRLFAVSNELPAKMYVPPVLMLAFVKVTPEPPGTDSSKVNPPTLKLPETSARVTSKAPDPPGRADVGVMSIVRSARTGAPSNATAPRVAGKQLN